MGKIELLTDSLIGWASFIWIERSPSWLDAWPLTWPTLDIIMMYQRVRSVHVVQYVAFRARKSKVTVILWTVTSQDFYFSFYFYKFWNWKWKFQNLRNWKWGNSSHYTLVCMMYVPAVWMMVHTASQRVSSPVAQIDAWKNYDFISVRPTYPTYPPPKGGFDGTD